MSQKNEKKIRQLVRRNRRIIEKDVVSNSWDIFFETMSQLKFRYRLKMAWKILVGKVEKKNESGNTGNSNNS